jgi:hypothetical protein
MSGGIQEVECSFDLMTSETKDSGLGREGLTIEEITEPRLLVLKA